MRFDKFVVPQFFVETFFGLVLAFLFLLLYFAANKFIGSELSHIVKLIKSEMDDAKKGRKTVGSINWYGFAALVIISIIVMLLTSAQKVVGFIGALAGVDQAKGLVESSNFFSAVYFLGVFLLISLVAVVVDERDRRRTYRSGRASAKGRSKSTKKDSGQ